MTKVVNIYQEEYDVYIGRAGRGSTGYFGNPFTLGGGARGSTIEKYKIYFYNRLKNDPEFKEKILALKGKTLGCFCKPKACHGDIIADYLDYEDILRAKYPEWKNAKAVLATQTKLL